MSRPPRSPAGGRRGAVTLVVLTFLAVLGLGLAGYLATSNQAMRLSNRTYARSVSRQLAEMGLERALWAVNRNDWSGWTLSGTEATRTLAFPDTKYGTSGLTGTIQLRAEHYDAARWDAGTAYAVGASAYLEGVWFFCRQAHSNQPPPNDDYWISAPQAWSPDTNYHAGDIALLGGQRYLCTAAHIDRPPPDASSWDAGQPVGLWSNAAIYAVDDVVLHQGATYRCRVPHSNQTPPNDAFWVSGPSLVTEGVAILPGLGTPTLRTQLRAAFAPAPPFPNAVAAEQLTNLSSSTAGVIDSYNSPTGAYGGVNVGSRAVLAGGNTGSTAVQVVNSRVNGYVAAPSAATSPYAPRVSFGSNAIVTNLAAPAVPAPKVDLGRVSRTPFIPNFRLNDWQAGVGCRVNDLVRSGSNWYVCKVAHTDQSPPNATYWTASTALTLVNDANNTLGTAGATTPEIRHINGSVNLNNSSDVLTINGPVVLVVNGSLLTQGGRIVISATGSATIIFSGQLYIGTSTANTGIDNQTLDPRRLLLIGTNTVNGSSYNYYWATLDFHGVLYLPDAYLHLWNSGSAYNNTDRFGAFAAKNVYFNHAAKLHYDTALRTATFPGLEAPAILTQWRELTDPAERIVFP